jgi:hypothetical protein
MENNQYNSLEMQFGKIAIENPKDKYKEKENETRDRYGSKEKKRALLEQEWDIRKQEERNLEFIDSSKRLYNNWFNLTKTKFWRKYVRQDVTYFGIYTRYE